MKLKVAPWKFNVCAFILEYAYHRHPLLIWRMAEPKADRDDSLLRVSGPGPSVVCDLEVDLRQVWREGKRGTFTTVNALIDDAAHEYHEAVDAKQEVVLQ